jgi:two-component system, OmpR family, phosphate regulon sensor histidine kinase PhoR
MRHLSDMKSKSLKILFIIALSITAGLLILQIFWLYRNYKTEQERFRTNVLKAVQELNEDISFNFHPVKKEDVEIINDDLYLVAFDTIANLDTVIKYAEANLAYFGLHTTCEAGYYCSIKKNVVQQYTLPADFSKPFSSKVSIPTLPRDFDYLYLHFPNRKSFLLEEMKFWLLTTLLLVIALGIMGYAMFNLYKQKFYNEVQKDFVNNISHEFKTPLAVMKIASEVLTKELFKEKTERFRRYASIIQNQTNHLEKQVQKILQSNQSSRKNLQLEKSKFNMNEMIIEAVLNLEPLIKEKNAKVDLQLSETIYELNGDRAYLFQTCINLIENALKYSSTDPHIVIQTEQKENTFCWCTKDNGIGIEPEDAKQIFTKFFRVNTGDRHNVKGFGLGLYFVHNVIEAHDGTITVQSVPNKGSEFQICLPI